MESVSVPTMIGETTDKKNKKTVVRQSDSTAANPTSKMVSSYIEI